MSHPVSPVTGPAFPTHPTTKTAPTQRDLAAARIAESIIKTAPPMREDLSLTDLFFCRAFEPILRNYLDFPTLQTGTFSRRAAAIRTWIAHSPPDDPSPLYRLVTWETEDRSQFQIVHHSPRDEHTFQLGYVLWKLIKHKQYPAAQYLFTNAPLIHPFTLGVALQEAAKANHPLASLILTSRRPIHPAKLGLVYYRETHLSDLIEHQHTAQLPTILASALRHATRANDLPAIQDLTHKLTHE